jgi:hypothetical protein
MLTAEGYQVVHISRHGSFEEGKDILAIAKDGTPCAFQLKGCEGGRITQKEWSSFKEQLDRLIEIPIRHPSIDETLPRKVYFVTNGILDEEVRNEIKNKNPELIRRGLPILETIVKGEFLSRLIQAHSDLWPYELSNDKDLLELYLADGKGYLDKPKLSKFLEHLILDVSMKSKAESSRVLASSAIFTSYALSPFYREGNHVAVIEGWLIYLGILVAFIEKNRVAKKFWSTSSMLAQDAIEFAFLDLFEELKTREILVEGNALVDAPFYKGRITWLIGLISAFLLWKSKTLKDADLEKWALDFISKHLNEMQIWGEGAIPQFLSTIWCFSNHGLSHVGDRLLYSILLAILKADNDGGLPDPYHTIGDVILSSYNLSSSIGNENFKGRSYSLNLILMLLTRRGWRGALAEKWKSITKIMFAEFIPQHNWEFGLWNCDNGKLINLHPRTPQSWKELVEEANQSSFPHIPLFFQQNPELFLLFLITVPHRLTSEITIFLDKYFASQKDLLEDVISK